jgi:septal ring factor EnvC (AmiA/AmiB activator)
LGGSLPEGQSPSAHHGGKPQDLKTACAAAVSELEASRRLIDLLERENRLVKDRLETETRTSAILTELNASRKAENEALRTALAAKTETLAAKNEVIASQQKLIDTLRTKKSSPWKRLGNILIGVAAGVILR